METIRHCEDGLWWAGSPEIPNGTGGGDSFEECRQLADEGVRLALEREDPVVERYVPAPA